MPDADYKIGWARPLIDSEVAEIIADSNLLALQDHINRAARDYSLPSQRWTLGIPPVPVTKFTTNKRSKPMTLTKDHKYKDNDGDWIEAESDAIAPSGVLTFIKTSGEGVYVNEKFAIPLALNVLGYDRPGAGDGSSVSADGFFVPGIRIQGDAQRAELAAKAISYLKSVDIYDQQAAERKAAEEAAAKREAEHERRVAVKEDARVSLASAVRVAKDYGISPSRAEELIAAATDYRAAVAAVGAP